MSESMRIPEQRFSIGGYQPGGVTESRMWMKDGLVSFDGPGGPWGRIIGADEIVSGANPVQDD